MGTLTKPHTFGLAPMISKKLIQIPCSSLGLAMTSSDMKLSIYGETRLLRRLQAQTLFADFLKAIFFARPIFLFESFAQTKWTKNKQIFRKMTQKR